MNELKRILYATNSARHAWKHRSELAKAALKSGYEVSFLCPKGTEVERLRSSGIDHIPLSISRESINPLRELYTFISVYRTIKKYKPDIYHGFTIKLLIYGGLSCKLLKINKCFLNITGLGSLFLNSSSKYRFLQNIVGKLFKWIFESKDTLAIFQNEDDKKFFLLV